MVTAVQTDLLLGVSVTLACIVNFVIISGITDAANSGSSSNDVSQSGTIIISIAVVEVVFGIIKFINMKIYFRKIEQEQAMVSQSQDPNIPNNEKLVIPNAIYLDKKELTFAQIAMTLVDCTFSFCFGFGLSNTGNGNNTIYTIYHNTEFDSIYYATLVGMIAQILIVISDWFWYYYAQKKMNNVDNKGETGETQQIEMGNDAENENDNIKSTYIERINGSFGILLMICSLYQIWRGLSVYNNGDMSFEQISYIIFWVYAIINGLLFFIFFAEVFLFLLAAIGFVYAFGYAGNVSK